MAPKNKLLALALGLALWWGAAGCSGSLGAKETPRLAMAPDGGQEEVLEEADDGFGRPAGAEETAGGVLVSLTYVGMAIGSAVLPFLALM